MKSGGMIHIVVTSLRYFCLNTFGLLASNGVSLHLSPQWLSRPATIKYSERKVIIMRITKLNSEMDPYAI